MQNPQYQIFTHKDLDGAVSLLTFIWSKPDHSVVFQEVSNNEIDIIRNYLKRTVNPQEVYILDLALRKEFVTHFDLPYITIIDHHQNSEEFVKDFQKAKILYKNYSSNSLLIRKLYAEKAPTFSDAQKKLILLADDHDSLNHKFEESCDLNILFCTEYKNQFSKFILDYKFGFKPFTESQKQLIKTVKLNAITEANQMQKFLGSIDIKGEKKNVLAVITENFNLVSLDYLIKNNENDLFFFINTKTEKVILRQKNCKNPINLAKFSEKFCEGSGNFYFASGKITPLFMELTKNLKPL